LIDGHKGITLSYYQLDGNFNEKNERIRRFGISDHRGHSKSI